MTPPVPDGPDTELAAATTYFRLRGLPGYTGRWSANDKLYAARIVRAVLARPAAGRDLTEYRAMVDFGPRWMTVTEDEAAAELRGGRRVESRSVSSWGPVQPDGARPAVARTDGQPPADPEDGPWAALVRELKAHADQVAAGDLSGLPATEYQCGLVDGYRGAAGRVRQVLIQQSEHAAPADDTAAPDMPAIVAGVERSYVEALNAILAAPGGSDDVDRWRGQAEAYRTVAERLRRDHGMARVEYGSGEWRRTHGVQPVRDSQLEATDG